MTTEEAGSPSLGDLFIDTHTSKVTNNALDDVSREYIKQMRQEAGTDENGDKQPITDEIYRKLMPPERNGRVMMTGPLGTKTKVFGSSLSNSANITRIQRLEAQLSDLKRKLEENEEELERRLKEREDEIERRMMLKLKEMLSIHGQTDYLDEMKEIRQHKVKKRKKERLKKMDKSAKDRKLLKVPTP